MSFGIGMARMASSLSRALGAEVDVSVHYAGPYDPATRKKKRGGPLTTTGRAVIGEYREDEFGEHVKRTDVPVYLPALDFTKPSNGDEIEVAVARDDGTVLVVHQCGASILLHRQGLQVLINAIDAAQAAGPSTPPPVVVDFPSDPMGFVTEVMRLRLEETP